MLTNSFCHIQGVGPKAEKKLWACGVHTWDIFLAADEIPLSKNKKEQINKELLRSKQALKNNEHAFFSAQLPSSEQ